VRSFKCGSRGEKGGPAVDARGVVTVMAGRLSSSGHRLVGLRRGGIYKSKSVHRLVLEAFVGPCPPGFVCRHINGDPDDNRLENLSWGTISENAIDRSAHGRWSIQSLRTGDVPDIWARLVAGESINAIASDYGVSATAIGKLKRRRNWGHVTDGLPGQPPSRSSVDPSEPVAPVFAPAFYRESPEEIWSSVYGAEGYRASTFGRVASGFKRRTRQLSGEWMIIGGRLNQDGRPYTKIAGKWSYIHTLVLEAFSCPRPKGLVCCHGDGDRTNNHISNLRWDTYAANQADKLKCG
jgi:hypothetical protein